MFKKLRFKIKQRISQMFVGKNVTFADRFKILEYPVQDHPELKAYEIQCNWSLTRSVDWRNFDYRIIHKHKDNVYGTPYLDTIKKFPNSIILDDTGISDEQYIHFFTSKDALDFFWKKYVEKAIEFHKHNGYKLTVWNFPQHEYVG